MNNTVGDEHIGSDDASAIDKDTAIEDSNSQLGTIYRLQHGAISKVRAVSRSLGNNGMVCENADDLFRSQGSKSGANGLECLVGRSEDGDVLEALNCLDEVGSDERATKGSQTGSAQRIRGRDGDGENTVNHMDYTAGEVDVLKGQRWVWLGSCLGRLTA